VVDLESQFVIEGLVDDARRIGRQIIVFAGASRQEIDFAFEDMARRRVEMLVISPDAYCTTDEIKSPRLHSGMSCPPSPLGVILSSKGGLISYSPMPEVAFRQAGVYAGQILGGEKVGDLPVQALIERELVINLKAAKTLGLAVPPSLLAGATKVIE
jgi:putative ABC transport system substrate-binding protein